MSDKNFVVVSKDDGLTETISWASIGVDSLPTDYFKDYAEAHPDAHNLRMTFKDIATYDGIQSVTFALKRADKTLGTYVTRVNKIVAGINPSTRESYTGTGNVVKSEVMIEMVNDAEVKLWSDDGMAAVNVDGTVFTDNYRVFGYWIDAILNPSRRESRLLKLQQVDADGNVCAEPIWSITYGGQTREFGANKPNAEAVQRARADILSALFLNGVEFDIAELNVTTAVLTGGGEQWLESWLYTAYGDATHALPKAASATAIETDAKKSKPADVIVK